MENTQGVRKAAFCCARQCKRIVAGQRGFVVSIFLICVVLCTEGQSALLELEKDEIKLGFIKLTDCAPLVIAHEKGFFMDEGLTVQLEAQANWRILLDRVLNGELDGAHMLAGQPIAAYAGVDTKADVITAFSLDRNGNAITVSNEIWREIKAKNPELNKAKPKHPIVADYLKPIVQDRKSQGKPLRLAMVFPVSTHNYELRYWLAAGGIHPGYYTQADTTGVTDGDVSISVTPPPQMPVTMEQGTIQGYCVGEPWNQQAVIKKIGVPVITDEEIWKNNPEKVFGVTREWNDKHPNTHVAVLKALLRACQWLDESQENRQEASKILSQQEYVGADAAVIANSMTGTFEYEPGDKRDMPDFNRFFREHATYPYYSDCIWYLTQMRRWGQIQEAHPDTWYFSMAQAVYRPEIWKRAAEELLQEGHIKPTDIPNTDGIRPPDNGFIDGIVFDARKPNRYLTQFKIGMKDETGDERP